MIVDDEPDLLEVVKERLEHNGFEVVTLTSGEDAIKTVQAIAPDLIILDIMLPDMNGYDLCYELKSHSKTSSIPVILFTAKMEWTHYLGDISKFTKADDYISKPFEAQVLLDKIGKLLNISRK